MIVENNVVESNNNVFILNIFIICIVMKLILVIDF